MTKHIPVFATPALAVSRDARRSLGGYVKRIRQAGEALPQGDDLFARPVYVPTRGVNVREGSEDALTIKSRGLST
jgi:hypothetical protein